MSRPASQALPASLVPDGFLVHAAALLVDLVASRRNCPAPRTPDSALADRLAAAHRLPAELPGLVGALAMRGAVFGAHGARVTA